MDILIYILLGVNVLITIPSLFERKRKTNYGPLIALLFVSLGYFAINVDMFDLFMTVALLVTAIWNAKANIL